MFEKNRRYIRRSGQIQTSVLLAPPLHTVRPDGQDRRLYTSIHLPGGVTPQGRLLPQGCGFSWCEVVLMMCGLVGVPWPGTVVFRCSFAGGFFEPLKVGALLANTHPASATV